MTTTKTIAVFVIALFVAAPGYAQQPPPPEEKDTFVDDVYAAVKARREYEAREEKAAIAKQNAEIAAARARDPDGKIAAKNAKCLIDNLPNVESDSAVWSIYDGCYTENPSKLELVKQGSGRGLFGYNSGAECVRKKAAATRNKTAAALIVEACERLYDKPVKR
jgi:hypothetical protein